MARDTLNRSLSVAPMMECTDRHERYFLRLISRHVLLYTEMVTTGAILHGDLKRLLGFDPFEHPVALQVGGSDPGDLARCAKVGQDFGYDEINLNLGCPSDRVQSGRFGACLMAEPELVADCVKAMKDAVDVPVTVKTRIGIDDRDSYEELVQFVEIVAKTGCKTFIFHARKAWLQGLSPKENREIPPLRYDVVYRIKGDFPELDVIVNGGITTLDAVRDHLKAVDGVMIGREAYSNPYFLASVDQDFFGEQDAVLSRHEILDRYVDYMETQHFAGVRLNQMTKHIMGLFQGIPGARAWRRYIGENVHLPDANMDVVRQAAQFVHASFL
ncbi:MAG: tRNA dihydrouridine(20/20a) synthase DusA [bacterium]|nr:tRNA dihydrouridine(20/20a) synthase DusA [bacterium]